MTGTDSIPLINIPKIVIQFEFNDRYSIPLINIPKTVNQFEFNVNRLH